MLFEFGYAKLRESVLRTEEEDKQLVKLDRILRGTIESTESGVPDWVAEFSVTPSLPSAG